MMGCKLLIEAPVNGGRNYRWTTVVVKSGYMLESPDDAEVLVARSAG